MEQIDWIEEIERKEMKEAEDLLREEKHKWMKYIYYGASSTSTTDYKVYYSV
jgi:hypothetical protein